MSIKKSMEPMTINDNQIINSKVIQAAGKNLYNFTDIASTEVSFSKNTYDKIYEELMERMNFVPMIHHNCPNCGGVLELRGDKHIFVCPYCRSVFAIGTQQINS